MNIMNHKRSREEMGSETLIDLPLAGQRSEETKAGAGDAALLEPLATARRIGGAGNDVLVGGAGDDLLIGGTTSY